MKHQPEGAGILVFGPIITRIMWLVIILAISLFLISCKTTGDTYTQQNPVDPRKSNIYTDGDYDGYLQQSPIDPAVTVQHNKKGKVEGTWKQNPIDNRKTIYRKKK